MIYTIDLEALEHVRDDCIFDAVYATLYYELWVKTWQGKFISIRFKINNNKKWHKQQTLKSVVYVILLLLFVSFITYILISSAFYIPER